VKWLSSMGKLCLVHLLQARIDQPKEAASDVIAMLLTGQLRRTLLLHPLQVVEALSRAHAKLVQKAGSWHADNDPAGQPVGWSAVQKEGQDSSVAAGCNVSFPLLSTIMDPGLALGRSTQAARVRILQALLPVMTITLPLGLAPCGQNASTGG
jgi:hypothetical protein